MSRARKARLTQRFAHMPDEVLRSEAWRTLPHSARTTLTVLAAQYIGSANGIQCLTRAICREYGIVHDTALRDATELERRGLIVKTHQALYRGRYAQKRVPSQFALAWRDITHRDGKLLDQPEKAPNGWASWTEEKSRSIADRQTADERSAAG